MMKINDTYKIKNGTTWKKDVVVGNYIYHKGDKYKAEQIIKEIKGVTIHNTPRVGKERNAEIYARATENQNMKDARVHFYVDEKCIYQMLDENEVGWHAGTGANGAGNIDTIAIEIISDKSDIKNSEMAEEKGAELTAWLLKKYKLNITNIYKHQDWSGKYCPSYILSKENGWQNFIERVKKYMNTEKEETKATAIRYKKVQDAPQWEQQYILKWINKGILKGNSIDNINLTDDMVRILIMCERMIEKNK